MSAFLLNSCLIDTVFYNKKRLYILETGELKNNLERGFVSTWLTVFMLNDEQIVLCENGTYCSF